MPLLRVMPGIIPGRCSICLLYTSCSKGAFLAVILHPKGKAMDGASISFREEQGLMLRKGLGGKPPYFDGEDYCMWSDKMRHHLTSLHASIWDIVEFGAHVPKEGDEGYDSDEVAQIRHFNSQATTILLISLCREEYNKVQGLKSAKEIWDVLKTAHEGDEVTKITKRKMIEGELGRFILNKGEEPQALYNRLKTLVNQVRNLGSVKWDDHEMVKAVRRRGKRPYT